MKKLEIEISETGEVRIEASGFAGKDCLAATKALEDALGVVGKRTAKLHVGTVAETVKAGR